MTHSVAELAVEMAPGDTLIFYSDGITDLQDADGEFYGDERFLLSLKGFAGKNPTDIVNAVMDEVGKFKGTANQADDVTVVAVRWRKG